MTTTDDCTAIVRFCLDIFSCKSGIEWRDSKIGTVQVVAHEPILVEQKSNCYEKSTSVAQ